MVLFDQKFTVQKYNGNYTNPVKNDTSSCKFDSVILSNVGGSDSSIIDILLSINMLLKSGLIYCFFIKLQIS